MEITACYHKNSSMVGQRVSTEVILVPVKQNVTDLQCIYTLKNVGARIWELLDSEETVAGIVSVLTNEYEVERPQAETDVIDFLAQLESVGAITRA